MSNRGEEKWINQPLSVCAICYAAKGNYVRPNVRKAQATRLEFALTAEFVPAMIAELEKEQRCGRKYFRFHDSGDLFSYEYAKKVMEICRKTPGIAHHLPTREVPLVRRLFNEQLVPENITIQISANYLDSPPTVVEGCQSSVVFTEHEPENAFICPATTTRHKCDDCRACWDKNTAVIAYKRN